MNAWSRKDTAVTTLGQAFTPKDGGTDGVWSGVSVFKVDNWHLECACAAAYMFEAAPDKWSETPLILRFSEEQANTSGLTLTSSPTTKSGDPQTCFAELNPLHWDLSGTIDQFENLAGCIYQQHRELGASIIPLNFPALIDGGACLRDHTSIARTKKKDSLDKLLLKYQSPTNNRATASLSPFV